MINSVNLGEIIKNRRMQLGISREILCEIVGCEVKTIYRIESGGSIPNQRVLNVLIQKLDLLDEKYCTLASKHDFEIQEIQNEIVSLNAQGEFAKALDRIQELEDMCQKKDKLLLQFIRRSRLVAGKLENGTIQPYNNEERLKLLFEIILISVKHFDIDHIANCFLSFEDVKIINQIATTYIDLGDRRKAIHIYRQLLEYTEKHYTSSKEMAPILILIAYNYSSQLGLTDRYEESLEIAEKGYDYCVKFGVGGRLFGQILCNMAHSLYYLKRYDESKSRFYQSYYVLQAREKKEACERVKAAAKKLLGIEFVV